MVISKDGSFTVLVDFSPRKRPDWGCNGVNVYKAGGNTSNCYQVMPKIIIESDYTSLTYKIQVMKITV